MTGSVVERLVPEPLAGNLSGVEREQLEARRVGAAAAVAFGSGALMLAMFALQLGVLSTFLSEPVVKALTSGAALHVLVSQLPSLLGLSLPRQIGCFSLFKTLAAVLTALARSSPAELTISALSLALLVPVKELNVRFRDRLPTPIPGEVVMAVWMVTWVAVVTLNVDLGLAVGVVVSMMTVVCRTQRVQCLALGLAEGTELYRPLRESHKLLQVPGLCILSYPTPLYFATRGQFRHTLEWHLGFGERSKQSPKLGGLPDKGAEPVRVMILDFSGISFADAAGAREVVQLTRRCQDAGICLLLAQCNALVLETLTRAGLLDRITPEQLFVSVQDAAAHALERLKPTGPKICTVWV